MIPTLTAPTALFPDQVHWQALLPSKVSCSPICQESHSLSPSACLTYNLADGSAALCDINGMASYECEVPCAICAKGHEHPAPGQRDSSAIRGRRGRVEGRRRGGRGRGYLCPRLQRADVGLGGQGGGQPRRPETADRLPRLLPTRAPPWTRRGADAARAQSHGRARHAQVHGGGAAERAFGVGRGQRLLRRHGRGCCAYTGSHTAVHDERRGADSRGGVLPAGHRGAGGAIVARRAHGP